MYIYRDISVSVYIFSQFAAVQIHILSWSFSCVKKSLRNMLFFFFVKYEKKGK